MPLQYPRGCNSKARLALYVIIAGAFNVIYVWPAPSSQGFPSSPLPLRGDLKLENIRTRKKLWI